MNKIVKPDVSDRVKGVLLGLAAGDRNGGPTQLALRLAQSLLHKDGFDLDDVGQSYLTWWKEGAFDTGPVTARVMELVESGKSFSEAAKMVHQEFEQLTAGCNPAHRIAPISMQRTIADDQFEGIARQEAALTHLHSTAADVSTAVALLCRGMIYGYEWKGVSRMVIGEKMYELLSKRMGETLQDPRYLNGVGPPDGGFAPNAIGAAVYFLDRAESFDEALDESIKFAGPANYCPVLVGAIGGARWGASSISSDAISHLGKDLEVVQDLGKQLAEPWE